ncbi:MAG TPA: hypothetical protein VL334_16650 [Anaerolineae bacterium]|nr:hypothetical protein [Anaerolineae bacterium]
MSEQANPIKRLLLWLSGAPAESGLPAAPAPPVVDETRPTPPVELSAPEETGTPTDAPVEALEALEPTQTAGAAVPSERQTKTSDPVNDAEAYGVVVVPADAPEGATYWRAIRVHHLTPNENQGRQHIFLDALDEAGNRSFGAQARVTWPGGEQTLTVDKALGEPGTNFPMWKWQICAVEMLGLPSDRVENLHTGHPDEPPGLNNTLFHHSFEVVYQRAVKGATEPPVGGKIMEHYILFGPPASHRTAVYLDLTRSYLLAQQPTLGYSIDEASLARHVIIVGELQDISQESEDALRLAGCQVQRVQGTPEQVTAAFRALQGG